VNGKAIVYPSFPRVMIWKDIARILKEDVSNLEKLRDDLEKYFYPVENKSIDPVEISNFILLITKELTTPLNGLNKVNIFRENVFHPWMMHTFNKHIAISKDILFMPNTVNCSYLVNDKDKHEDHQKICLDIINSLDNA